MVGVFGWVIAAAVLFAIVLLVVHLVESGASQESIVPSAEEVARRRWVALNQQIEYGGGLGWPGVSMYLGSALGLLLIFVGVVAVLIGSREEPSVAGLTLCGSGCAFFLGCVAGIALLKMARDVRAIRIKIAPPIEALPATPRIEPPPAPPAPRPAPAKVCAPSHAGLSGDAAR